MSFLSPGSSFLTYQVSSGLLGPEGSQPNSQAASSQNLPGSGGGQGTPSSGTNLQGDKTAATSKSSSQVAPEEPRAQVDVPL